MERWPRGCWNTDKETLQLGQEIANRVDLATGSHSGDEDPVLQMTQGQEPKAQNPQHSGQGALLVAQGT